VNVLATNLEAIQARVNILLLSTLPRSSLMCVHTIWAHLLSPLSIFSISCLKSFLYLFVPVIIMAEHCFEGIGHCVKTIKAWLTFYPLIWGWCAITVKHWLLPFHLPETISTKEISGGVSWCVILGLNGSRFNIAFLITHLEFLFNYEGVSEEQQKEKKIK